MVWSLLSVLACTILVIRLLFWSDDHRRESRWYYRVLLFLVTIYAAHEVVQFCYNPGAPISPWTALFHMIMLYGSFIVRPEYLPWNGHYDPAGEVHFAVTNAARRIRFRLRHPLVHGRKGRIAGGKCSPDHSPHRFR